MIQLIEERGRASRHVWGSNPKRSNALTLRPVILKTTDLDPQVQELTPVHWPLPCDLVTFWRAHHFSTPFHWQFSFSDSFGRNKPCLHHSDCEVIICRAHQLQVTVWERWGVLRGGIWYALSIHYMFSCFSSLCIYRSITKIFIINEA